MWFTLAGARSRLLALLGQRNFAGAHAGRESDQRSDAQRQSVFVNPELRTVAAVHGNRRFSLRTPKRTSTPGTRCAKYAKSSAPMLGDRRSTVVPRACK